VPRKLSLLALFLALWFLGDRGGARVIAAIFDHSREPIAELYGGHGSAGVVLLGNSRAYRHFDLGVLSQEFNVRVANLSLPGASGELSEALFADYLDRYGPPRVVIVELSGLASDSDALKNMRPFAGRSERLSLLLKEHFPRLYYAGEVSHLFNYNSEFSAAVAHKIFYPMPNLTLDGSLKETDGALIKGRYFAPHRQEIEAMRGLVKIARARNIDIRLVLSPALPAYAAANDIDALRSAVHGIADGLPVWDFIDSPPMDAKMFYDPTHLNRLGVATFMDDLRKKGFFRIAGDADQESSRNQ
jgi:hypothetical protein